MLCVALFSYCFPSLLVQNSSGSNVVEEEMEPEPYPPNLERGVSVAMCGMAMCGMSMWDVPWDVPCGVVSVEW